MSEPTTPLFGSIETLLGYKGKDLAIFTDAELLNNFKDVFDFEKSLRDVAGLLKPETPLKIDKDDEDNNLITVPNKSYKQINKEKHESKRQLAIKELLELNKEFGINK